VRKHGEGSLLITERPLKNNDISVPQVVTFNELLCRKFPDYFNEHRWWVGLAEGSKNQQAVKKF
jgi:hypothetical protein